MPLIPVNVPDCKSIFQFAYLDLSKSFEDRIIDENLQAVESPAFSDLVFFRENTPMTH